MLKNTTNHIGKCKTFDFSLKKLLRTLQYFRHTMDTPELMPPAQVRGMTILDREKFQKLIRLPILDISDVNIHSVLPHLKPLLFKMDHLKPVQHFDDGKKRVMLHPKRVQCLSDLPEEVRNLGLTGTHLNWDDFQLNYQNWKIDEILRSVLPVNQEGLASFSRIGHIVHVNLKDHLIQYKNVIGQVIKDKVVGCRTVINKMQTIENTYRNFQIDLLCGDADYKVEVKENGAFFEFDFSTVYWNPRLATEHERIIKLLKPDDVLYDVFAGVGPFSIPAAKKKCIVLANDLNPESFKWLEHNAKRNKVTNRMKAFNKDGREFIMTDIKNDLLARWQSSNETIQFDCHITMNLPAMAVEFLDSFTGLFSDTDILQLKRPRNKPLVHLYCFAKGDNSADVAKLSVETHLGCVLKDNIDGIHFVRNVAPNKDMYRVSFWLTDEILFASKGSAVKRQASPDCTNNKKKCN